MGRKNQVESVALPHARLEDASLYLKVFQLYFGGHPSAAIARRLEMTPQSVNRALKKYRHALVRQPRVRDYLNEAAAKAQLPYHGHYVWLVETTIKTMGEDPSETPAMLKACFSQCPHMKAPQRFTFDHVDVSGDVEQFPFPFTPELKVEFGKAGFLEAMDKRKGCRHCPFGAGAHNLATLFAEAPEIYVDINYYLACQRIRSEKNYYFHLVSGVLISWVRRIAAMRRMKAERRGVKFAAASALETRMQNRIVGALFSIMSESAPGGIGQFGNFG